MTEIQFSISGMHCIGCQEIIEKKLQETDGIRNVSVSYETGKAFVFFDEAQIEFAQIKEIISSLNYTVLSEKQSTEPNITTTISFSIIIIALFVMLQRYGILNLLVPSRLAESGMGYGMLFVVGLFTSVHCIAMCGGIHLSQCIPHEGEKPSVWNSMLYNLGRAVSYTIIGFLLGGIGMLLGGTGAFLADWMQGILKIVAGILMVVMGVSLLGIFPQLKRLQPHLPEWVTAKILKGKAQNSYPFLVGMLNGLMPCVPLQSMQILALASGNPFTGSVSMLMFSLGTVPLMAGLGTIVSALGRKFSQAVMQIGGVLVAVMGFAMLLQGGSLSGWFSFQTLLIAAIVLTVIGILASVPFQKQIYRVTCILTAAVVFLGGAWLWRRADSRKVNGDVARISGDVQTIHSTLSSGSYPDIIVQTGIPVEWTITAPAGSINGCNNQMIIREYQISHTFTEGENIITFTPTEAGTYSYSCWMEMIQGTIQVTNTVS